MNEGFEWRMFPPTDAADHLRIHYMQPDGVTSFGFVEQRERGKPLNTTVKYFVSYNGGAGVTDQPVNTLADGMYIIEWLVRERNGESK